MSVNHELPEGSMMSYTQAVHRATRRLGKTMQQVADAYGKQVADTYGKHVPKLVQDDGNHLVKTNIEQNVMSDAINYCNQVGVDLQWFISHAVRSAITSALEAEEMEEVKRCQHCFCINEIEAETCNYCGRPVGE